MEILKLNPGPNNYFETEINAEQLEQLRRVIQDHSFTRLYEIPFMEANNQVPEELEWYEDDEGYHILIGDRGDPDSYPVEYSRACEPLLNEVPGIDAPNSDEIPFRFASEDEGIPDVKWE